MMVMNNVEIKQLPKKVWFSQTRGKNHKNWLYSRFGNFYSRSCNFFDSYQITLKAYLDDTIYGNEQCCSKINAKKACLSQTRGKNHKDCFYCGFGNSYCNLSLVTFLIVIIKLSKHIEMTRLMVMNNVEIK